MGMLRQNKEEMFSTFAENPPPAGSPPTLSDFLVVPLSGEAAVISYIVTAEWGTVYASSVWVLRDEEWLTVFYQASNDPQSSN